MKWIVISTLTLAMGAVLYLANYLGYQKPVVIEQKQMPAQKILFKKFYGAYHLITPTIREVESWARGNGYDCKFSFGHYMDDPNLVEQGRLRSRGGCLIDKYPVKMPEGFEVDTIPEGSFVKATFEGSPGIGPYKVYPAALGYFTDHKLNRDEKTGVYEIYEIHPDQSMTTTYLFPIL